MIDNNNDFLIPNAFIQWHLQPFDPNKIEVTQLYKNAGFSKEELDERGGLLNASQFSALIKSTILLYNDEAFSVTSIPIKPGAFQLMTQACISCVTLKKAIERMLQFYTIINDELLFKVEFSEQHVELYFDVKSKSVELSGFFSAFMMSSIWRWLSWMIAKTITLSQVEFNFIQPSFSDEISHVFNSDVYFSMAHNKLIFDRSYLEQPIKQCPESLISFLKNAPQCLLSHYKSDLSISNRLREHLESYQNIQPINLEQAAEFFHCSPQSLMRNLRKEHTHFKEIKDKVNKQRAINLLLKSELSIERIADQLGFVESSNFYRNFKRWTGITPRQYRDQNG